MVKSFSQTPNLLEHYNSILVDQESHGFIEKVPMSQDATKAHFIPHHLVIKDSSTTPVRIVYDCSCHQSSTSPSLNSCLTAGPPLQNDMCAILILFRIHNFAFSTDLEKAFLQIQLDEEDHDFISFLWPTDPKDPASQFQAYCFTVIPFGLISSPFILNATVLHHLDQYETDVSQDMQDNLYVDNVTLRMKPSLITMRPNQSCMMPILILVPGHPTVHSFTHRPQLTMFADPSTNVNLLGFPWNPSADIIYYASKDMPSTSNTLVTKREVLQDLSKVYDPLGYIAPVFIKAKILMQELWKQQLDWDKALDELLLQRWKGIIAEIQASLKTTLNRQCLPSDHSTNISLHIFVDASILAYGTVSYITADSHVSFLMSKTRVAPLKIINLPKLELMAAFIGAALGHFPCSTLQNKFPQLTVRLWSDSQIVLYWLYTHKALKQFIANLVNFIKQLFPNTDWGYCPSAENPADLTTRGITAAELSSI